MEKILKKLESKVLNDFIVMLYKKNHVNAAGSYLVSVYNRSTDKTFKMSIESLEVASVRFEQFIEVLK